MSSRILIDAVLNQYKMRQDNFQIRKDNILNKLYLQYPKLGESRTEYASMRIAERKNRNNADFIKRYKKKYQEYENLLNEYIVIENINQTDIEYTPICEHCKDTGYIGETEKRYCHCVIANAAQQMLEGSNINDEETILNFDFEVFGNQKKIHNNLSQRELMKKLYNYIVKWIYDFPNCQKRQMLISGKVGLGKSYCLNAIAYDVLNKGYSTMMITSFAINEAVFDEIKNSDSTALSMMRSVDLLLIDDLGSEQVLNNITQPTLFNVLNERVRRNLHTIVSTNLSGEQIEEKYGSRVYSRLIDRNRTAIFPLSGQDIRSKG